MNPGREPARHHSNASETKPAVRTTEFLAYLGSVLAVLIASAVISDGEGEGNSDYFRADEAFLFITILTVGYMVARGIAKAGNYHEDHNH